MKGSEHLVLRVRLGFALVFLCIYRNTKPLQLPPGPMLGDFHSLSSKPEETSLIVVCYVIVEPVTKQESL